jgi:hypothetical protein
MTTESAQQQGERDDPLASLSSYEFVLLTTMRKSGVGVPTAMWFAYEQGRLYIGVNPFSRTQGKSTSGSIRPRQVYRDTRRCQAKLLVPRNTLDICELTRFPLGRPDCKPKNSRFLLSSKSKARPFISWTQLHSSPQTQQGAHTPNWNVSVWYYTPAQ